MKTSDNRRFAFSGFRCSRQAGRLPFNHTDYTADGPMGSHYDLLNADREASRFQFNDTTDRGFWMLTRYDDVLEGFQRAEDFTTNVTSALNPSRTVDLLPQHLHGAPHIAMRRVINPYFAPAAVRRLEEAATKRCIELIEELAPKGGCDFVSEFAIRYPTDMFLHLLGPCPRTASSSFPGSTKFLTASSVVARRRRRRRVTRSWTTSTRPLQIVGRIRRTRRKTWSVD